jgi:cell division protein DivIC
MKNPFKSSMQKYPFLKLFGNRYFVVLLLFGVWLLFLDDASFIRHRALDKEIKTLESNKKYYQDEINKDRKQIKELNNIEKIEHYAREKYYMQKSNEDVYIIEYENDTIKK